jgi:hypothetical protein
LAATTSPETFVPLAKTVWPDLVVSAELSTPVKRSPTSAVFELMVSVIRTLTSLPEATVSVTLTGCGGWLFSAAPELADPFEEAPEAVALAGVVPEAVPAGAATFCVEAVGAGGALLHPENAEIESKASIVIVVWKGRCKRVMRIIVFT